MAFSKVLISDSQLKVLRYDEHLVGCDLFSVPGLDLANAGHREQIRRKLLRGQYNDVVYMISGCRRSDYSRLNYNYDLNEGPCRQEQNRHGFEVEIEGYEKINKVINENGCVRELTLTKQINKYLKPSRKMQNRVSQGVSKTCNLIELTFGPYLKTGQNFYLCPVLPWCIDNEVYRYSKELYNSMLRKKCEDGLCFDKGIEIKWIETMYTYQTSYDTMVREMKTYGDEVHYCRDFMLGLVQRIMYEI